MADVPHTQGVYGLLYRMVKGCVREGPLASMLIKKRTVFSSMYLPSTHSHQHPSWPPTLRLRLMQHLKDLSFLSSLAHVDLEPPCRGYRLAHDHDISFPWGLYFSPRFTPPTALSVACGSSSWLLPSAQPRGLLHRDSWYVAKLVDVVLIYLFLSLFIRSRREKA